VLSADGHRVAAGGTDGKVHVWDTRTDQLVAIMEGHTGGVPGVAFSSDGEMLVSGGFDGAVRIWAAASGACLRTIQPERRYERLDITGLTGVTDAERTALLALGAVDEHTAAT